MKMGTVLCCILSLLFAQEASACSFALQMRTLVEMDGSGMVPLLLANRNQDLKRMYELFRRTDASLELMRQVLGSHLKGMGAALVQGPELSKEPVEWVHRLLAEKDKYDRWVQQAQPAGCVSVAGGSQDVLESECR